MAYKVHVGNNIVVECDTMPELLGLLAVFGLAAAAARQSSAARRPSSARARTGSENQLVKDVLAVLRDGPPSGVKSDEVGKAIGLTSSRGLGPKARILGRALRRKNLDINRVRKLRHTARNGSYWMRGDDFSQALSQFGLAPSTGTDTEVSPESEGSEPSPTQPGLTVEGRGEL